MKKKFFIIMDSLNIFFIYLSTILSLIALMGYGICNANNYALFIKAIWMCLFDFNMFILCGNIGYKNMPKFFNSSIKFSTLLLVVVFYMLAIVFYFLVLYLLLEYF